MSYFSISDPLVQRAFSVAGELKGWADKLLFDMTDSPFVTEDEKETWEDMLAVGVSIYPGGLVVLIGPAVVWSSHEDTVNGLTKKACVEKFVNGMKPVISLFNSVDLDDYRI